ncbi:3-oxoacyl-[acyl-carrier-protein] synthase, mitochondrial [Glycine soja]
MFSDRASSSALALSSTKGAIGHLLGAAGAVEAIFAVLAIRHGIAPLTLNLTKPDPVFGDGFMPLSASEEMPIRVAMSNSFGFGGTNASLLFAQTEEMPIRVAMSNSFGFGGTNASLLFCSNRFGLN